MRPIAKAYVACVILLGTFAFAQAYAAWHCESRLRFAIYLALTLIGSSLKITLPTVNGTMSVSFFFVLISIAQLSMGETIAIGGSGFLVQYFWRIKSKPKLVQAAFNLSLAAVAAAIAWRLFNWGWLRSAGLEFPLMMAAAAVAYFLVNTIPVGAIIALTEDKSVLRVWRDCYLWAFPYYLLGAALAGALYWGSKVAGWQVAMLGLPSLYLIYRSYHTYLKRLNDEKRAAEDQRRYAEEQRRHAESISELHLRTIEALALAIEAKDQTTHDHLQRVQVYALEIGREMGLTDVELEALRAASVLHDIGKLAVPEHIISKPGKLTVEEFDKMKIHPIVGAEILEHVCFPYPVVPIVRSHHEKWDGNGYPDGLKGDAIPTGARILAAVDCLDALASDRQYRRAIPLDDALAYVVKEAGASFDPKVVEILQRRYQELNSKADVKAPDRPRLSRDVKVTRGKAPSAGFEKTLPRPEVPGHQPVEFLERIGAARQEAQILLEITSNIGSSLSLDATLSIFATGLAKLVPYGGIAVYLRKDAVVKCEFALGEDARLFSSLEIPSGQGLSGWVVENKKPIVNGNPAVEPGYLNDPDKFTRMRSALAVPLEGVSGVLGALTLYDPGKDAFTRDHLRIVMAISSKLGVTIENAVKYQQAEHGAVLDYLTHLPNARALFMHLQSEVHDCREKGMPLIVLVCDLDGFKAVNDRLGHLEGNRLLQVLAAALRRQCRPQDYVARMGGDEFAITVRGVPACDAGAIVERFQNAASEAAREALDCEAISLSLGLASLGTDGEEPEELLAAADRRMYEAKRHNKARKQDLVHLAEAMHALPVVSETARTNERAG